VSASVTALVFVGLLLTVIGLLVAGNLSLVALGVASLFGGGIVEAVAARSAR
jgi:hypothetical protein